MLNDVVKNALFKKHKNDFEETTERLRRRQVPVFVAVFVEECQINLAYLDASPNNISFKRFTNAAGSTKVPPSAKLAWSNKM